MQYPTRSFSVLIAVVLALTSACTLDRLPEPQVEAKASNASAPQDSPIVVAIVKTKKANLRARPLESAAVINTVNKGDLLSLTGATTGPWYQIRDRKTGAEGWIHGNTIALLETAKAVTSGATSDQTSSTTSSSAQRPRRVSPQASSTLPRGSDAARPGGRSYINRDGIRVPSPVFSDTRPAGASARCRDGSYSFSRNRRGTCSHHGGVAEWY